MKIQSEKKKVYNEYHRFYNGIGYSTQNVENWPTKSFYERLEYYQNNRTNLLKYSNPYFKNPYQPFAGTSFWPHFSSLVMKYSNHDNILAESDNKNYIKTILLHKDLIYKIPKSSFFYSF